jgi:hypothetical protein
MIKVPGAQGTCRFARAPILERVDSLYGYLF